MSRTWPNIKLVGDFRFGEDGWNDEMNENIKRLDLLYNARVLGIGTTLPGSALNGEGYILTSDNKLRIYDSGVWNVYDPQEGWCVYDMSSQSYYAYKSGSWVPEVAASTVTGGSVSDGNKTVLTEPLGRIDTDFLKGDKTLEIFTDKTSFNSTMLLRNGVADQPGQMFYNSTHQVPYYRNSTEWVPIQGLPRYVNDAAATTAISPTTSGSFFYFDTTTLTPKFWDGSQWVSFSANSSSAATVIQTAHGFSLLDQIFKDTDGLWKKAVVSQYLAKPRTHTVVSIINANTFLTASDGIYTIAGHGKTVGVVHYLGATAGSQTSILPTTGAICEAYVPVDANKVLLLSNNTPKRQFLKHYVNYRIGVAQTIPNNVSTVVNYGTLIENFGVNVTTGAGWTYQSPETGYYHVEASVGFPGSALNMFCYMTARNFTNGLVFDGPIAFTTTAISVLKICKITTIIRATAGDLLTTSVTQVQSPAASSNTDVFSSRSYIKIHYLGEAI